MVLNFKALSLVLAFNLLAGGSYLFATQDIAESPAVYKTGTVFGYDATGIIFNVNDADPTLVDTISFHVTPSYGSAEANYVAIQTEEDGIWTECSLRDGVPPARIAVCRFGDLPAEDVTDLKITAE